MMMKTCFALIALLAAPATVSASPNAWLIEVDVLPFGRPPQMTSLSLLPGQCSSAESRRKDDVLVVTVCHRGDAKDAAKPELVFTVDHQTKSGTRKLSMPAQMTREARTVLSRMVTHEGRVEFGATLR